MKPSWPADTFDTPSRRRLAGDAGKSFLSSVTIGAALFAATLPLSAHANSLESASGLVEASTSMTDSQFYVGSGALNAAASTSDVNEYGAPFSAVATAGENPYPDPRIFTTVSGSGVEQGTVDPNADAQLDYYFEVIPPDGNSGYVPVIEKASIVSTFSAGTNFDVEGIAQVSNYLGASVDLSICPASLGGCNSTDALLSISENQTIIEQSGESVHVQMIASILDDNDNGAFSTLSYNGSIIIDPTFEIDPIFLAAHPGYSLEFSPGVGDAAPGVPEPSTWSIILLGLGGLGLALRASPSAALRQVI